MPDTTLRTLLQRNARHVEALPDEHFAAVQESQEPPVVSICCSDSRVSQEGMWAVEEPGWLFTPSTIGNQVWDQPKDELVVDGNVLYPIAFTDTRTAVVVGHTGCGAVTAALEAVQGEGADAPPGVAKWVALLVPVVEDGLEDDRVDPGRDVSLVDQLVEYNVDRQVQFLQESRDVSLVDQLVEYNVDRQVQFLQESDEVPADTDVYGFVYDFQGLYGDEPGRAYLVNADGVTDTETLEDRVPERFEAHVRRLL